MQSWVNKLSKEYGLAPKTIRNAYQNLDSAMDQAVLLKMVSHNPCVGVVLPKAKAYKAEVYDQQEITTLFNAAKGTEMYLPILLEISVGLRRGELIALRWDHVDLDAGIIHVREASVNGLSKTETKAPKSSAGIRDVAIGQNVIAELRAARAEYNRNKLAMGAAFTDSGLVVCQKNGKPYRPDSMSQKWRRFYAKNNLKPIRFHDLRHTCATAMVANGVDAATVKERLGHADVSTTLKYYTHRTKAMDQSAAKKLDDMIFSDVI